MTTAVIADGWMGLSLHKHGGRDEHVQWMMRWDETSVLPWLAATSVFIFVVLRRWMLANAAPLPTPN